MPRIRVRNTDPSIPGEPRYRRHKASGKAVVTLSYRDHYLGDFGTRESHDEYRRVVGEWIARGRKPENPGIVATKTFTIDDLADRYGEAAKKLYRTRDDDVNENEIGIIKRVCKPLRALFGRLPAAGFGPKKLADVRERFIADGLSRSVCNRYTDRIKRIFGWAAAEELIPATVWHGLLAVKGLKRGRTEAPETEAVKPVPDAHVDAIKPHVSRQVWAMIELQRATGMRPGEVVLLRSIDLDTRGALWMFIPEHHKTEIHGKSRKIMLGKRAQEIIRPFLKPDVNAFIFSPIDAETDRRNTRTASRKTAATQGNVVGSNRKRRPLKTPGERYTSSSYRKAIAAACTKADVPIWGPNRLRHSYATNIRKEFGVEGAQVMLGHSKIGTTQVYAERNEALAVKIAEQVG